MKLPDVSNKMYYDPDFFKWFSDLSMFWWRQSFYYRSNWRVLHIDGAEGFIFSRNLPVSSGRKIQFFQYAEKA